MLAIDTGPIRAFPWKLYVVVVDAQHAVKYIARGEQCVQGIALVQKDWELQRTETSSENTEETRNILSDAL